LEDSEKPTNCLNCYSERILGPYCNSQTAIQIGWATVLEQDLYVCADCGYSMQFTIKKRKQQLIDKEEKNVEREVIQRTLSSSREFFFL